MKLFPIRLSFVPRHAAVKLEELQRVNEFVLASKNMLVLTGAGISTESGIPDYRSEEVGLYAKSDRRPIQHRVFMTSEKARRSYWSRNYTGWPRWSLIKPNIGHLTLSKWDQKGKISYLVTQNVDQLHFKAGSSKVIELHGTNSIVSCTTRSCCYSISRFSFQTTLRNMNPDFHVEYNQIRPDGDVEIPQHMVNKFKVPSCPRCSNGILKPNVIFFGDNVPSTTVNFVKKQVEQSDSLLVVGTSLFVYSGYRFVLQAKELNIPIAIVNIGETRADNIADLKLCAKAGDVLPHLEI